MIKVMVNLMLYAKFIFKLMVYC